MLFTKEYVPLAKRMVPDNPDGLYGQEKILGKGKILRNLIENDRLVSAVFYGPPGTGKSALASLISKLTDSDFASLNATVNSVTEIKQEAFKASRTGRKTVLFIDEIHRFNRLQQDSLLPIIEDGTIIFIGATTHNPVFYLTPALSSRIQIFKFEKLEKEALENILAGTLVFLKKEGTEIIFEKEAENLLLNFSNGDARRLINTVEMAVNAFTEKEKYPVSALPSGATPFPKRGIKIVLSEEKLKEILSTQPLFYDRKDTHYDVISAFIKSVRGSDPDAAIYWLAKMLKSGEDPLFIARRLIILASEDIGNANPHALMVATAAYNAVDSIGMPEGRIPLAQAAVYLASVPKSNSSYMALEAATADLEKGVDLEVPLHLKDSNIQSKKKFKHGIGYKYPHDFKNHYIKQKYLPEDKKYYFPLEQGSEINLKKYLESLDKELS